MQAQILNLLLELQERLGLTYLFVAHDLWVVKHISDRVAVMYVGKIVEIAPTEALFAHAAASLHRGAAVGGAGARSRAGARTDRAGGRSRRPADPPPGCHFHPRCRYAERAVPPGDAGAGGDRTGALGAVPQGAGAGIAGRAPLLTTSSGESGRQFTENRPAASKILPVDRKWA